MEANEIKECIIGCFAVVALIFCLGFILYGIFYKRKKDEKTIKGVKDYFARELKKRNTYDEVDDLDDKLIKFLWDLPTEDYDEIQGWIDEKSDLILKQRDRKKEIYIERNFCDKCKPKATYLNEELDVDIDIEEEDATAS